MADQSPRPTPARIDAIEVTQADLSRDGRRLLLRLRDDAGRLATVSLPVACLNAVLGAMPCGATNLPPGEVHRLDSWSLSQGEEGPLLTLHLPGATRITLSVKPWQMQAIASLAALVTVGPDRLHRASPISDRRESRMSTMRVVQVGAKGGAFELIERAVPDPKRGEVRIRVQACGVCHSDVVAKEGLFPGMQ